MKPITKLIIGIAVGLLVIGFIVLWDLVIKPNIESEQVVVVKPNVTIHKNDEITLEMLTVEDRNRQMLIEGYLKPEDINTLVGYQASQTIVGNQIVSTQFIDLENSEPDPKKGESIRPIPNQWIYALPATIRRKDSIDIYLVKSEALKQSEYKTTEENVEYVGLSPEQEMANEEQLEMNNENEQTSETLETETDTIESVVPTNAIDNVEPNLLGESQEVLDFQADRKRWLETKGLSEDQWQQLAIKGDIPVLVDVFVAYAKDGAGNEIQNGTSNEEVKVKKEEDRLNATGTITNLELLLNEENHRLLMNYINEGYQLYITYN